MSTFYGSAQAKQQFVQEAPSRLDGDSSLLSLSTGVPVEILEAARSLGELMEVEARVRWHREFAQALRLDSDLRGHAFAMMEWLLLDLRHGLIALARSQRTRALVRLLAGHCGRAALMGAYVGKLFPGGELTLAFAFLKREVAMWKSWKNGGLDDWRASRAALEIWKARELRPKDLSRSLMSVRAAYGDAPEVLHAQCEALKTLVALEPLEGFAPVYQRIVKG